jgi:hypothetical protein
MEMQSLVIESRRGAGSALKTDRHVIYGAAIQIIEDEARRRDTGNISWHILVARCLGFISSYLLLVF